MPCSWGWLGRAGGLGGQGLGCAPSLTLVLQGGPGAACAAQSTPSDRPDLRSFGPIRARPGPAGASGERPPTPPRATWGLHPGAALLAGPRGGPDRPPAGRHQGPRAATGRHPAHPEPPPNCPGSRGGRGPTLTGGAPRLCSLDCARRICSARSHGPAALLSPAEPPGVNCQRRLDGPAGPPQLAGARAGDERDPTGLGPAWRAQDSGLRRPRPPGSPGQPAQLPELGALTSGTLHPERRACLPSSVHWSSLRLSTPACCSVNLSVLHAAQGRPLTLAHCGNVHSRDCVLASA